jgi:dephospho-CoA kinase
MKPVVLVFAGRIASGKSTIAQGVAAALCWPWVSFGEYVRAEAQRCGVDESRAMLQQVGEQLIAVGWEPFCRAVLAQADWRPGQSLVVDGLRHVAGLQMLRDLAAPQPVVLVLINVPESVRAARLSVRGIETNEQQHDERHASEAQVNAILPQIADMIIDGSRPVEELVCDITHWVEQAYQ